MAIDASENLYVVDRNNHTTRKITPQAVVTDFAGGGNSLAGEVNGIGTSAIWLSGSTALFYRKRFNHPKNEIFGVLLNVCYLCSRIFYF
ncbi:MAG: hypothetical protein EAZ95_03620 [Bacteroidetes bacterium]|nr:MAG: hypothetical protein EAZ95_03620 [Bacteroidota bacterium]